MIILIRRTDTCYSARKTWICAHLSYTWKVPSLFLEEQPSYYLIHKCILAQLIARRGGYGISWTSTMIWKVCSVNWRRVSQPKRDVNFSTDSLLLYTRTFARQQSVEVQLVFCTFQQTDRQTTLGNWKGYFFGRIWDPTCRVTKRVELQKTWVVHVYSIRIPVIIFM